MSAVPVVRDFAALVEEISGRAAGTATRADFSPPPRFGGRTFSDYLPQHPSQSAALTRLTCLATELCDGDARPRSRWSPTAFFRRTRPAARRSGIYLDGGFGVGKTHLLVALWHAAPGPKAYLSFDELMFHVGLAGIQPAAGGFRSYRLIAIDEWELDDPGNLKLALAFLRAIVAGGTFVAVTSNTLPLELGNGRFSQKDFGSEIEELAGEFEVVTIEGEDYRHRRFEADPGRRYFLDPGAFEERLRGLPGRTARDGFAAILSALADVHPIRYREIASALDSLFVEGVVPIAGLPDALRWVHFIDSVYDAGTRLAATGDVALGDLFEPRDLQGPYGKKLSRCLSRMEEMLGSEARAAARSALQR